ncbi:MAG TPA: MFS transporter [Steroidobacteraceae bacterium]|nr:MFS transporter [Steroidobacteraceae bacterium]
MTGSGTARAQDGWRYYGWWGIVVATLVFISVTNGLTIGGIQAFDTHLLQALQIERGPLKLGDAIQLGTAAIFTLLSGWAADRFGVRPVMTIGVLLLAGAFYGLGQVETVGGLYMLRFVMGLGLAGAGLAVCVVIVSRWFISSRGLALGVMLAGTSLGSGILPSVFTQLIETYEWRDAASMSALAPLALLPIIWFSIREWPARIGLAPYGASSPAGSEQLAGPLLSYRDIVARRQFWLIGLGAFATFYSILGISNNLFLHSRDLGFAPSESAALFVPLFILGLIGKVVSGVLSDILGRKRVWILSLLLMLGGALMLMTLQKSLVMFAIMLFGFGWGGNYSLLQAIAADAFGSRSLGRVMGAITVLDAGGGALGPWITSLLYDAYGSYTPGFGLICVLIAVAIAFAMVLKVRAPVVSPAAVSAA